MPQRRPFRTATLSTLLAATMLALAVGCESTPPIKVYSAYGPGMTFTMGREDYAWVATIDELSDYRSQNREMHDLIIDTFNRHLAAKGYVEVSAAEADYRVDYHVVARIRGESNWRTHFANYEEGSLVFDVINPGNNKLIWRSTATTRLNESAPPELRRQRIDEAVGKMLEEVPHKDAEAEASGS